MRDKPDCNGSFAEGTACGECERCIQEAHKLLDGVHERIVEQYEKRRAKLPCPLCGSNQIQICLDYSNPMKDLAKCRECRCQAPLMAWNKRWPVKDSPAQLEINKPLRTPKPRGDGGM